MASLQQQQQQQVFQLSIASSPFAAQMIGLSPFLEALTLSPWLQFNGIIVSFSLVLLRFHGSFIPGYSWFGLTIALYAIFRISSAFCLCSSPLACLDSFSSTGKDSSRFHVNPRRIFLPSNFTLKCFLDQFESLSYRSLVYTEFGGLTGIKVIRNFFPNFASFDRSFFEFVWLTDGREGHRALPSIPCSLIL